MRKLSKDERKLIRDIQLLYTGAWVGLLYVLSLADKNIAIALAVTGLLCTTIFVVVHKFWRY